MSEIRESVQVREVRSTSTSNNHDAASAVLGAVGLLAAGAVIVTGAALYGAYKGAAFVARKLKEGREADAAALRRCLQPVNLASITSQASAPEMLRTLCSSNAVITDFARIEPMVANVVEKMRVERSSAAAKTAARELCAAVAGQNTRAMCDSAFAIAVESARAVGFESITQTPERGYLLAENRNGTSLRVDITPNNRTAAPAIATDTDGYDGVACQRIHDAFREECRKRGLIYEETTRRAKPPRAGVRAGSTQVRKIGV